MCVLLLLLTFGGSKVFNYLHGQWEYDGGIFLRRYLTQCLQVAQLQRHRTLINHVGGLFQGKRRFLVTLGRYDFGSGFTRRLGLCGHGSLHGLRQANVLQLDTLDFDAP
jgi:hypothetical protein